MGYTGLQPSYRRNQQAPPQPGPREGPVPTCQNICFIICKKGNVSTTQPRQSTGELYSPLIHGRHSVNLSYLLLPQSKYFLFPTQKSETSFSLNCQVCCEAIGSILGFWHCSRCFAQGGSGGFVWLDGQIMRLYFCSHTHADQDQDPHGHIFAYVEQQKI